MNVARKQEVRRRRVVVADDNLDYLNEICDLLETRFEVVARTANGRDCVNAVHQLSPSIVITDISMPKVDGIEATRQIMKSWPGVKVVILSAYDDPIYVEAAVEAGAAAYVVKAAAFDELIPAIDEVLAGGSYLPIVRT